MENALYLGQSVFSNFAFCMGRVMRKLKMDKICCPGPLLMTLPILKTDVSSQYTVALNDTYNWIILTHPKASVDAFVNKRLIIIFICMMHNMYKY